MNEFLMKEFLKIFLVIAGYLVVNLIFLNIILERNKIRRKIEQANYIIICNNCGKKIYRQRESKVIKNPEKYRCKCGGKLHVDRV